MPKSKLLLSNLRQYGMGFSPTERLEWEPVLSLAMVAELMTVPLHLLVDEAKRRKLVLYDPNECYVVSGSADDDILRVWPPDTGI